MNNGTPADPTDDFDAIVVPNGNAVAGYADRAGYPVLTVPAGYGATNSSAGHNPIGVTFVGTAFSEGALLADAYAIEQAINVRLAPSYTNPSMWRCVQGSTFFTGELCNPGDRLLIPTPTDTPTDTATPTPSNTPSATPSATPIPTDTATDKASPTDTPTPTVTATETGTAKETSTVTATATFTASATPTNTPVPPTATATSTNTRTPRRTGTATRTATHTSSPTRTNTPIPPTSTRTATRTGTPTRTATARSTPTPSPTPHGPCPGDVDGDGHVGPNDLVLVTRALFSVPGAPRWNPNADLTHNGIVDPIDLLIVVDSLLDPHC